MSQDLQAPLRPSVPSGAPTSALFRLVPALDSLRSYSVKTFGSDAVAGLTVAAVALPQAMAYAQIAGIPPQYGLYTAIVMTTVGALLDSSRQLINGPTNAISIAVLSALVGFGDAERIPAMILLTLIVGSIQTGISMLRLGDLSRYVSHSVIVGFTLGAAVLLVLDQLKNLLGLPASGSGDEHFLQRVGETLSHIGETNLPSLFVGLTTVAVAVSCAGSMLGCEFDYPTCCWRSFVPLRSFGSKGWISRACESSALSRRSCPRFSCQN